MKKQFNFLPVSTVIVAAMILSFLPLETFAQSAAGAQSIVKKFIDVINILFPAALVFGLIYDYWRYSKLVWR